MEQVGTPIWATVIDRALARIVRCSPHPVAGVREADLARYETRTRSPLPASYRRFIAGVGVSAGDFLRGSDLRFDELDAIRGSARRLLEDDGDLRLPPDALPFCAHQGYQFLFLHIDGSADPAVFYYLEGNTGFEQVAPTFSAWLAAAVVDEFGEVAPPAAPASSPGRARD